MNKAQISPVIPPANTPAIPPAAPADECITLGEVNMIGDIRKLWTELCFWTKDFMECINNQSKELQVTTIRLNRIPEDFLLKLTIFFGSQPSEEFINLLAIHIVLLQTLATALKRQDQQGSSNAIAQLYVNADAMSTSLAAMNPFWLKTQWYTMLYSYISTTVEEMVSKYAGNDQRSVDAFERVYVQILLMADYMSTGIMRQLTEFPPRQDQTPLGSPVAG